MLEGHSHIRMTAKRVAMDSLTLDREPKVPAAARGPEEVQNSDGAPTKVPTLLATTVVQ